MSEGALHQSEGNTMDLVELETTTIAEDEMVTADESTSETSRKAENDEGLPYRQPTRLKSECLPSAPEDDDSGEEFTRSVTPSSGTSSTVIGFIPTDTPAGLSADIFESLNNPSIDDDTPAAEALRANADVHVNKAAKLARKIHVQTVRNIVKKATKRGMGNKRGKPPRIPPHRDEHESGEIFIVEEEDDEDSDLDEEALEEQNEDTTPGYVVERDNQNLGVFDGVHHIPAEVMAATIETGKKCKRPSLFNASMRTCELTHILHSTVLALADPHDIISNQRWRRRRKSEVHRDHRKSYVKGKVSESVHACHSR